MTRLQCVVVTPEKTVLDQPADFVALPLVDGEIGIALNHAPLIGRLGYGELRVVGPAGTQRFYVEGGFVEVINNGISVLTNRAERAEELDPAVAEEQLAAARTQRPTTPELAEQRDRVQTLARAQLRVARRARA